MLSNNGIEVWDSFARWVPYCDSAWKKDPLGGVIGVQ
jgi:hypothetical protein